MRLVPLEFAWVGDADRVLNLPHSRNWFLRAERGGKISNPRSCIRTAFRVGARRRAEAARTFRAPPCGLAGLRLRKVQKSQVGPSRCQALRRSLCGGSRAFGCLRIFCFGGGRAPEYGQPADPPHCRVAVNSSADQPRRAGTCGIGVTRRHRVMVLDGAG